MVVGKALLIGWFALICKERSRLLQIKANRRDYMFLRAILKWNVTRTVCFISSAFYPLYHLSLYIIHIERLQSRAEN